MSGERYVDRAEIAFLLGVEPRTITNYVKRDPDFPSRVSGTHRTFPVQRCLTWQRDRLVANAISGSVPPVTDDRADADRRSAIANAAITELRLARLRGEVVDVQEAAKVIRDAFGRVRARLLSVPGEYASQILHLDDMPRAVLALRQLVDTVLAELQSKDGGPTVVDDDEDGDDDGEGSSSADAAAA